MTQLQIAYLPRAGTQERWRRLCQEVAELRRDQFVASCQRAGITQVQVRVLHMLQGELLLLTIQVQEPQQAREALASSPYQFDHWLQEQLQVLLGVQAQQVLSDSLSELIFNCEM
jgi:hypothetical protein